MMTLYLVQSFKSTLIFITMLSLRDQQRVLYFSYVEGIFLTKFTASNILCLMIIANNRASITRQALFQ